MKTTTFLILFGTSLFGASAGTAALLQSGRSNTSSGMMPLEEILESEGYNTDGEMQEEPSQSARSYITNIELYKFQNTLSRPYHNPEAPWNLCKWAEFNAVDPSLDDVKDITEADKNNFFDGVKDTSNAAKSCLLVSIDRKEYTLPETGIKRWSGTFSWFWAVMHQDKALVTVNVAETTAEKKLGLTGVTYLLEKDAEKDAEKRLWKVKYYTEVMKDDKKEIDVTTFDNIFPKPNTSSIKSTFSDEVSNNWRFMEDSKKMNEICEGNECDVSGVQVQGGGSWHKYEWLPEDTCSSWWNYYCDNMSGWSGDPKTNLSIPWWDHMYGKDQFDLGKHLSFFTYGTWKKK